MQTVNTAALRAPGTLTSGAGAALAEQQKLLQTPQAGGGSGMCSGWEIPAVRLQQLRQAAKAAAASPKQLRFAQNLPKAGTSGPGEAVSGAQQGGR